VYFRAKQGVFMLMLSLGCYRAKGEVDDNSCCLGMVANWQRIKCNSNRFKNIYISFFILLSLKCSVELGAQIVATYLGLIKVSDCPPFLSMLTLYSHYVVLLVKRAFCPGNFGFLRLGSVLLFAGSLVVANTAPWAAADYNNDHKSQQSPQ
jgi:hypothetical protein